MVDNSVMDSHTRGILRDDPGGQSVAVPPDGQCQVDAGQLTAMFDAAFEAPNYQPPVLPSTALELMHLARRPDVTFPRVAALLRREPLIVTQVLRLAQSPVYRRAEPVRSLEQAASLLGLRALADLFVQATLTARVFRAPAYEAPMNQLRDHSIATATIARIVCRETSFAEDYAYLCGLLHDVGIAASIIVLAERFGGGPGKPPPVPVSVFWAVVRETHEATADRLAALWNLPADVRVVIGHHHSLEVGGEVHPLAAVVCVADSIAMQLAERVETAAERAQVAVAIRALGLREGQLRTISDSAAQSLAASMPGQTETVRSRGGAPPRDL